MKKDSRLFVEEEKPPIGPGPTNPPNPDPTPPLP